MRTTSKPNTGKPGISTANCYRASVKSAATDLEALIDGYDIDILFKAMQLIRDQIAMHGVCDYNRHINEMLNSTPLPAIHRPIKPKAKKARRAA